MMESGLPEIAPVGVICAAPLWNPAIGRIDHLVLADGVER